MNISLSEFLDTLKASKDRINWYNKVTIRGVDEFNYRFCPVTAFHFIKTGEKADITRAHRLCKHYGLSMFIPNAADSPDHLVQNVKEIREKLLEAIT